TSRPTTSRPTTSRPTTSRPTTSQPTTSQRTANRLLRRENESTATLEAKYLRQLQRDYAPSPWWSALMVLGFIGWVGSAFSMIVVGFDSDGRLIARKAWPWAGAIVAGLALWMIALRLA
ncbi:MAG: hypothetical protein KC609_18315, partial [Myxococcales bacterium]|nr:hypothetical protein [Myxococcales bacterium]